MEALEAIFPTVLVVFIVSTMLSAGFNTTVQQITAVLTKVGLVAGVVVVGFVVRPLIGWGAAELFGLATPAFIAIALLWRCPGAPFGAKLVMIAKADLQSGAVLQVLLASIGSITFAATANAIIATADLGSDVSLPKASSLTFVVVLAGAMLGSWRTIVDPVGSRVMVAAIAAVDNRLHQRHHLPPVAKALTMSGMSRSTTGASTGRR